jgi:hypothetical protein
VATPALAVFINPGEDFRMAALAIFLHHTLASRGKSYILAHLSGVKTDHIVDAIEGFPKEVTGKSVVGEMAVNAGNAFMGPGVKPGFVFRLQYVATAAKLRGRGFGKELGRPKGHKQSQDCGQHPETGKIEQNLGKPGNSHKDSLPVGLACLWIEGDNLHAPPCCDPEPGWLPEFSPGRADAGSHLL